MKDLQINASSYLWLFVLIAQLLDFLKGLPFLWAWLFSWGFSLLGSSDLLFQDRNTGVMPVCNTPSLKKNKWIFCSCLNFLKKMSSERTKTSVQTYALFSLFQFIYCLLTQHSYNDQYVFLKGRSKSCSSSLSLSCKRDSLVTVQNSHRLTEYWVERGPQRSSGPTSI